MAQRLRFEDLIQHLSFGQKERVNCIDECGGGNSMVISYDHKGHSAYCFRCGAQYNRHRGTVTLDERMAERAAEAALQASLSTKVELPHDITHEIPSEHSWWLTQSGITQTVAQEYSIGWSDALQRIVLPVTDHTGNLTYWQARAVYPDQVPKYINPSVPKDRVIFSAGQHKADGRVVVCEDILSAIRVGEHIAAFSILGTKLSDDQISILEDYPHVSFWLDPDEAGKKGAIEGVRILSLVTRADILHSHDDPKRLPNRLIREVLGLRPNHKYEYVVPSYIHDSRPQKE